MIIQILIVTRLYVAKMDFTSELNNSQVYLFLTFLQICSPSTRFGGAHDVEGYDKGGNLYG